MEIRFYSVRAEYGCFSNFAPYPFQLKEKLWPTSEHYFQAQKFADTPREEEIRVAKSPMIAARLGRSRKHKLRSDWEEVKDKIMREAVQTKFAQNEAIRKILLDTGDALLIEHTQRDRYWGDAGDGTGKNMLAIILMSVREELRQKEQP